MELARLKALIDMVSRSALSELEITEGGERVFIAKRPPQAAPQSAVAKSRPRASELPPDHPPPRSATGSPSSAHAVTSPMFGIFHRAASPDSPPYVQPGSLVRTGDTLGLVEAMKSFNAIAADRDGTVSAILVDNGQEVEPGQVLIQIDP